MDTSSETMQKIKKIKNNIDKMIEESIQLKGFFVQFREDLHVLYEVKIAYDNSQVIFHREARHDDNGIKDMLIIIKWVEEAINSLKDTTNKKELRKLRDKDKFKDNSPLAAIIKVLLKR